MRDYIYTQIENLQSLINQKELNNSIEKTLLKIRSEGCALVYGAGESVHTSHQIYRQSCQISVKTSNREDIKTILWDIFHELGHHLDKDQLGIENINNKKEEIRREKTAWINADKEFLSYPELMEFKESYLKFRLKCLTSYEIDEYVGNL